MVQENNLGAGIALDKNYDIKIDETGDIKSVSGVEEVQKDVSYNMSEELQEVLGHAKNVDSAYDAKRICKEVIDSYANVDEILGIRVGFGDFSDNFDLAIELVLSINDEQKELVVTV